MDFTFTEEQQSLVGAIADVSEREFRPRAFNWNGGVPWPNLKRLAELGYLGMCMPEEVGGGGRPAIDGILAIETVARFCPQTASFLHAANTGPLTFIARLASDELKARYIPPVIRGEKIMRIAISEPEAGSDVGALSTYAQEVDNEVVLNGAKTFTSHAGYADFFLVYVRFGPERADFGCVVVEKDTPGLTLGPPELYMSGEHYCPLFFEDCRIPSANVVLRSDAFKRLMNTYNVERCGNAARAVGVSQMALEMTVRYMKERRQFGKRLADMQGLQWMLADMATDVEAARLLLYRAMTNARDGAPTRYESSLAKMYASEAAKRVTDTAMQIHGAMGYVSAMPIEGLYRLVRGWSIAGGTTQIHKNGIARHLLRDKKSASSPAA
jgi:alkylation response protein AidB-like acyl-CoA dehydrogenase